MGKSRNGATAPAEDVDLLELETSPEKRRRVSIDGKLFDLKPPGSLKALRPVMRAAEILHKILAISDDEVSPEMEQAFNATSLAALRVVLPAAPVATVAKLSDIERMRLLVFFLETMPGLGAFPSSIRKRNAQPGSKGSTGDRRATG